MDAFPVEYSTLSSDALLRVVAESYKIASPLSITFIKRGFNDTYLIKSETEKYILRVYKHNWRSVESIEGELELLNYLNAGGISVSYPIKTIKGYYIRQIQAPEGTRYCVLFSFAEGLRVRKLSPEQAFLLGIETGKIHVLTKEQSFGTPAHNYAIEVQFETTLSVLKPILTAYTEHYNYLESLKNEFIALFDASDAKELPTGICHGDLQAENFHVSEDNTFTFFDFDFFGEGYLAYDIGVFRWYDHKNKTPPIMEAFLRGYQTQRKLSATELKLIPYFSTLRALFQMTLYCRLNDGKQLPLWPASEVALFVDKVRKWMSENGKGY